MNIDITEAVKSLVPDTAYSTDNGKIVDWDMSEIKSNAIQPTDAEIATEVSRLQGIYDSQEYARNRAEAYPSIADQLDDIYHNGVAGWKTSIKAVKDQYPKT